jgi:hypothetical protein
MTTRQILSKLNLGCGFHKYEGWINVDSQTGCSPDVVLDLAKENWPWKDGSVSHVRFSHSLEQIPHVRSDLIHVFRELYRVCASETTVEILCLHPRHDDFALNPFCTTPISPEFLGQLSVQSNLQQIANGQLGTSLALDWGVNFQITRHKYLLTQDMRETLENKGQAGEQELRRRMRFENNICHSIEIDLTVIKTQQP